MVDKCRHPIYEAKKDGHSVLNDLSRPKYSKAYHILSAFHSTLQNPTDVIGIDSCIERIEWDDIRALAVESFSIDLKMPLITRGDTTLRYVFL